jgi:hypothetical protein
LLAGRAPEEATTTADELLATDPTSVDIRRVAALARLRGGRPADGLALLPEDGGDPRWLALRAGLLRAAGQTAEADQISTDLDPSGLLPEETALLSK